VGLNSLKSLNLTNVYPNNKNKNNNKNNNKVKSKPLELFELAGKNHKLIKSSSKYIHIIYFLRGARPGTASATETPQCWTSRLVELGIDRKTST
jgi:hypothetical protein